MEAALEMEIDVWLRNGGIVVTASDRAARALTAAYHRARRAEGFSAWPAPDIRDWKSFARHAWFERDSGGRLVLNATQEAHLWAEIAARENYPATVLDGPRLRIADLAMEAHDLLATHAPAYLNPASRAGWQQDTAAFSGWLAAFDRLCGDGRMLSASRVPLELINLLKQESGAERPPLLLAGFDRILPVQRRLFDAWGTWRVAAQGEPAQAMHFYRAADAQAEFTACALWCKHSLTRDSKSRLLIVAQDVSACRGELERALLRYLGTGAATLFEFSLGVPLSRVPIAAGALLTLRWLSGSLREAEVDWLISADCTAANAAETAQLHRTMRRLRRRGLERTEWTLDAFCGQTSDSLSLPGAWTRRMIEAKRALATAASNPRSPIEWADLARETLKVAGWPGFRPLASAEFQAVNRWEQALDACASLGFNGRRMAWREFLDALARALEETLFAPESRDAPIQIAGPAESAGLDADAIWFLGADEDAWPAAGSAHPFLPIPVQREGAMPHSAPQLDADLARTITVRLLASASEMRFSYAGQTQGVDTRPSRIVAQLAGRPQPLPAELLSTPPAAPLAEPFHDESFVPFLRDSIEGGAAVLTAQSQCPFKAFATARLGARGWEPAEAGLTPAQRGQLVHAVLHAVWGPAPAGIRSLAELRTRPDLEAFIAGHVRRVMREQIPPGVRDRMPRRYLELEASRLTRLVRAWLDYEMMRQPFTIVDTEVGRAAVIEGLMLTLRLDRIDRLRDGTLLVIDYKTGDVKPSVWDLPRPDDVQLPLYAGFALDPVAEPLGGLVFAKVRTGEGNMEFVGRARSPSATLFAGLKPVSRLMKTALTERQLSDWKDCIEDLARDFIAGRAEVAPRDYPKTCQRCGLQALCRIHENRASLEPEDDERDEEGNE